MKTSELTGPALDWAVAKIEFDAPRIDGGKVFAALDYMEWSPSTDWSQGGPIIERERIELRHNSSDYEDVWYASKWLPVPPPYNTKQQRPTMQGNTALIAAMRCYVASKLGGEVEIPKELQ